MKNLQLWITCILWVAVSTTFAQIPTQTIRGTIIDVDAKIPLIGATVRLLNQAELIADVTDLDGNFRLEKVPVGRQTIEVRYVGYDPAILSNLNVSAGKELVIQIELKESAEKLDEIVIKADKKEALNEMATVSARSFSVEETQRYAAAFWDPARMAQNFAGVTSAGDDTSNEIVIRGNSPQYVQWRLEGIQIPGPNHYANKGSSGGGISMLSSSMLTNSDFYTGAFPAEIGNALAGAFDLRFRNGNNEKREHALMLGALGLEASTEGPIGNNGGSYLINYRYSTVSLLSNAGFIDLGGEQLNFQDLALKINLPTEKMGTFSLFGLGGVSTSEFDALSDTTTWQDYDDIWTYRQRQRYRLAGLSHKLLFADKKTYLQSVAAYSIDHLTYNDEFLNIEDGLRPVVDEVEDLKDEAFRLSSTINHKANAQNTFQGGLVFSQLGYNFSYDSRPLRDIGNFRLEFEDPINYVKASGSTQLYQAFGQWKWRPKAKWTINSGIHFTHLSLTKGTAIEPRVAVKWQFVPNQSVAFSAGLHSQHEHLINYTLNRERADGTVYQPNKDLGLTKSAHFVLGYDRSFANQIRIKIETYYQHLFNVPVDPEYIGGTILNAEDVYDVIFNSTILNNEGTGRNIGIDLTFEKFLDRGLYYLVTGSIFDSSFDDQNAIRYSTRYNSKYNLTVLGGKEIAVGKNKKNSIGFNAKMVFNGGTRYTEYDFATREPTADGIYKLQSDPYFRTDFSVNWRKNRPSSTHTISLEIQNVTNRLNPGQSFPDFRTGQYRNFTQNGLLPNFNYRVEF